MVKGTAKQAVILHPGEQSGFEQAIFILAPGQAGEKVAAPEDLLRLADDIARKHTVATVPAAGKKWMVPWGAGFLLGSILSGAVCYFVL